MSTALLDSLFSIPNEFAPTGPMLVYIYNHAQFDWTQTTTANGFTTFSLNGALNQGEMRTLSIEFNLSEANPNAEITFTSGSNSFSIQASKVAE